MGESYNGIRTLADLFAVVKIPNKLYGAIAGDTNLVAMLRNVNKLSGVVASEWLLYLSSNLVGPRISIFNFSQKKIILPFCLSLPLPSPLLPFPSSYIFAFFISTFTPTTNMKVYP